MREAHIGLLEAQSTEHWISNIKLVSCEKIIIYHLYDYWYFEWGYDDSSKTLGKVMELLFCDSRIYFILL